MDNYSLDQNKSHFDAVYSNTAVTRIVETVRHYSSFLEDATKTDTSWAGFYCGGFRNRLREAKVLELGAGNGLNALIMGALGAHVLAIDISPQCTRIINQASQELGLEENVWAMDGDFIGLPISGPFDYVVVSAPSNPRTGRSIPVQSVEVTP